MDPPWIGGVMIPAVCALASCAAGPSRAERRAHDQLVIETARTDGARFREALPSCTDTAVPEGGGRVEGTLTQGDRICTDMLCRARVECCNECEKGPVVTPDDRRQKPVPILLMGGIEKLFGGAGVPDCAFNAWWKEVGNPRVRMTWYPDRGQGSTVELCRVRAGT